MKGRTYCNKVRDAAIPLDLSSRVKKPVANVNGKLFLFSENHGACVIPVKCGN